METGGGELVWSAEWIYTPWLPAECDFWNIVKIGRKSLSKRDVGVAFARHVCYYSFILKYKININSRLIFNLSGSNKVSRSIFLQPVQNLDFFILNK